MNIDDAIIKYAHEGVWALSCGFLAWIFLFPFRYFVTYVKQQWEEKTDLLMQVHEELTTQRTNCLSTLQEQSKEQTRTLSKVADVLTDIRIELASQTGHIKALNKD